MLTSITFMTALAAVALGIIVGYLSARKDNTHALSEAMIAGFDAGMIMGQKLMMSQVQQAVGPMQQKQDIPTDDSNKVGFKFTPSNTKERK